MVNDMEILLNAICYIIGYIVGGIIFLAFLCHIVGGIMFLAFFCHDEDKEMKNDKQFFSDRENKEE